MKARRNPTRAELLGMLIFQIMIRLPMMPQVIVVLKFRRRRLTGIKSFSLSTIDAIDLLTSLLVEINSYDDTYNYQKGKKDYFQEDVASVMI